MLVQVDPEGIRVAPRKVHVVIQVKTSYLGPIDAFILPEVGQKFILRGGGGIKTMLTPPLFFDKPFHGLGYILGGSLPISSRVGRIFNSNCGLLFDASFFILSLSQNSECPRRILFPVPHSPFRIPAF